MLEKVEGVAADGPSLVFITLKKTEQKHGELMGLLPDGELKGSLSW